MRKPCSQEGGGMLAMGESAGLEEGSVRSPPDDANPAGDVRPHRRAAADRAIALSYSATASAATAVLLRRVLEVPAAHRSDSVAVGGETREGAGHGRHPAR